jgi:hypothetical protein
MTSDRTAILWIGSPKGCSSTSESIGFYLLDRLQKAGWETSLVRILPILESEERIELFLKDTERVDLVILATPLYVDSLPSPVIRMMETIHERVLDRERKRRFLTIVNSGFPERVHNEIAIEICRKFAKESGFEWYGGIPVSGGGVVGGQPLAEVGGARNIRTALDMVAKALIADEEFPPEAAEIASRKVFPHFLYRWIANRNFRKQAKKQGRDLNDRPLTTSST